MSVVAGFVVGLDAKRGPYTFRLVSRDDAKQVFAEGRFGAAGSFFAKVREKPDQRVVMQIVQGSLVRELGSVRSRGTGISRTIFVAPVDFLDHARIKYELATTRLAAPDRLPVIAWAIGSKRLISLLRREHTRVLQGDAHSRIDVRKALLELDSEGSSLARGRLGTSRGSYRVDDRMAKEWAALYVTAALSALTDREALRFIDLTSDVVFRTGFRPDTKQDSALFVAEESELIGPDPFPLEGPDGFGPGFVPEFGLHDDVLRRLETDQAIADLPTYRIDVIEYVEGHCGGDLISLHGDGFGSEPGAVVFPIGKQAAAESWTNSEIRVRVPPDATSGPLSLVFPQTTDVIVRGKIFPAQPRRLGGPIHFEGGRTRILSFAISPEEPAPGDILTVSWDASPDPEVHISVDVPGEGFTASTTIRQGVGIWEVQLPGNTVPRELVVRIDATGACVGTESREIRSWIHRRATVEIAGIEITQATQFYRTKDRFPVVAQRADNSIPLYFGKRTCVRVYLRTNQEPTYNQGRVDGVIVTLIGARGDVFLDFLRHGEISARHHDSAASERADWDASANFFLPDDWVASQWGGITPPSDLILTANISIQNEFGDVAVIPQEIAAGGTGVADPRVVRVQLREAAPLTVVMVLVEYDGPGGGPAPDAVTTAERLRHVRWLYPVREIEVVQPELNDQILQISHTELPLDQDSHLSGILNRLENIAMRYRSTASRYNPDLLQMGPVWVAVLPEATQLADGLSNLGDARTSSVCRGVAVFPSMENPVVAAHLIADAVGFTPHTNHDPAYPDYGFRALGRPSVGEFGVPVERFQNNSPIGGLGSPLVIADFMRWPLDSPMFVTLRNWVSPFTYQKLDGLLQAGAQFSIGTSSTGLAVGGRPIAIFEGEGQLSLAAELRFRDHEPILIDVLMAGFLKLTSLSDERAAWTTEIRGDNEEALMVQRLRGVSIGDRYIVPLRQLETAQRLFVRDAAGDAKLLLDVEKVQAPMVSKVSADEQGGAILVHWTETLEGEFARWFVILSESRSQIEFVAASGRAGVCNARVRLTPSVIDRELDVSVVVTNGLRAARACTRLTIHPTKGMRIDKRAPQALLTRGFGALGAPIESFCSLSAIAEQSSGCI